MAKVQVNTLSYKRTTLALLFMLACTGGNEKEALKSALENAHFAGPIVVDLPDELTPATEAWYLDGWNGFMPRIQPAAGDMRYTPSGLAALLLATRSITVIQLPRMNGPKLNYLRYTEQVNDLLLAPENKKIAKLAQREFGKLSYSKCYDVNPAGTGKTTVCSFVFSYQIVSALAPSPLSVGEGSAKVVKNLDTGNWEPAEFSMTEPPADSVATLLAVAVAAHTGGKTVNVGAVAPLELRPAESEQRCAEYAGSHPPPKAPWYARIRGRQNSTAKELPATELTMWEGFTGKFPTEQPVGSISVLETGELCVGTAMLSFVREQRANWEIRLSSPSRVTGNRLLMLLEIDRVLNHDQSGAWIVHPDSTRPLSPNLLPAPPRDRTINVPTASSWSPNGQHLVLNAPGTGGPGVFAVDTRTRNAILIRLNEILHNPHPEWSGEGEDSAIQVSADEWLWKAPNVLHIRLHLFTNYPNKFTIPDDSVAIAAVDLSRGVATRVR